ncbi:hypothetical protein VA7868_01258 [Vibrio aerogenes CECT 7868]|uniref:YcjX-like protein n=1 Tax=Vibrio aerogenes CECT 7868 TaxID=1216006 RepID=A0A1M5XQ32_9VIBR|nr:YcjX family protein [Vibrio aerogenes]SHI01947.1 hypothetical protein VA7868_01258 [Vibrio aerogenes CECT 7868]
MKLFRQEVSELIHRGFDSNLKIAVTGLSRAGKTAFITSLMNQIQYLSTHDHLPFLVAAQERRVIGTKRVPQNNMMVSRFDYDRAMSFLHASQTQWPEPTKDVSETRLAIKYKPVKRSKRLLGKTATLSLDIIDYPGEWLLDLPLLEMDFRQWSEQQMSLMKGQRADLGKSWLQACQSLDPDQEADEQLLASLSSAYTQYLHDCKNHGLHWVQPGRFVLPGELAGAPVLQFFPFAGAVAEKDKKSSSRHVPTNFELLHTRFEEYKSKVVQRFYKDYFATFDRQVVLVDCLTPLNRGYDSFVDMQQALIQILQSFRYGRNGILSRLFSPKIDKVLFCATKADHVTPDQHNNLMNLLDQMIYPVWQQVAYEEVEMRGMSLASIQATQAGYIHESEQHHPAIQGHTLDGELVTLYPGEVPARLPAADYWKSHQFDFVPFKPQPSKPGAPLPHLRMDSALEYLIGDKLR